MNANELSERLFALKGRLGIRNKEQLAKELGCSRPMLYLYETGQNEPPAKFYTLLKSLEIKAGIRQLTNPPPQVLTDPHGAYGGADSRTRMIPVVSWAHAGEAESYEELPEDWQDMVPTECPDEDAFSVILNGDSMEPRFYDGDQLIVMPNRRPLNGGLVVCRFKDDGIIFRQVEVIGEKIRLVPINTRYIPTEHREEDFSWIYPLWGMYRQLWK